MNNHDDDNVPTDHDLTQRDLQSAAEKSMHHAIALGVEAKKFLTSDLARYITDIAHSRVAEALIDLSKVDPTNVNEITRLQSIVAKYDHYERTLEELVAAGDSAYQEYLNGFNHD